VSRGIQCSYSLQVSQQDSVSQNESILLATFAHTDGREAIAEKQRKAKNTQTLNTEFQRQ
jgi:hypothetical protein